MSLTPQPIDSFIIPPRLLRLRIGDGDRIRIYSVRGTRHIRRRCRPDTICPSWLRHARAATVLDRCARRRSQREGLIPSASCLLPPRCSDPRELPGDVETSSSSSAAAGAGTWLLRVAVRLSATHSEHVSGFLDEDHVSADSVPAVFEVRGARGAPSQTFLAQSRRDPAQS